MLSYSTSYHLQQPIRALATSGYTNPTNYTRIPKPVQSKLNANSGLVRLCHDPLAEFGHKDERHTGNWRTKEMLYTRRAARMDSRGIYALISFGMVGVKQESTMLSRRSIAGYCSAFVNRQRDVDPLLQAAAAKSSNAIIHDAQPRLYEPRLLQCRNKGQSNRALRVIRRRICFGCSGTGFASKIWTTGGDVGTGQDAVSQAGSEQR